MRKRFEQFVVIFLSAGLIVCAAQAKNKEARSEEEIKKRVEEFSSSYEGEQEESKRIEMIEELGKTIHPLIVKALGPILSKDTGKVRCAVAKILGGMREKVEKKIEEETKDQTKATKEGEKIAKIALPYLKKGLSANRREPEVLAAILKALGATGTSKAVESIYKTVKPVVKKLKPPASKKVTGDDLDVALAGIESLSCIKDKKSIEKVLSLYKYVAVIEKLNQKLKVVAAGWVDSSGEVDKKAAEIVTTSFGKGWKKGWLKFDLSSIPKGADIAKLTLMFYCSRADRTPASLHFGQLTIDPAGATGDEIWDNSSRPTPAGQSHSYGTLKNKVCPNKWNAVELSGVARSDAQAAVGSGGARWLAMYFYPC